MEFQKWGEELFIEHLTKQFPSKGNIMGIGDDCAVIPVENGNAWLVTTDALVEGIHFLQDQIPPRDLGYKTVAVNVSDIAAMGGVPKFAFLSIALPKIIDTAWTQHVIDGIKEACDKWNVLLLGGDTVGSKRDIFLNITLIGSAPQKNIKYRHTAEFGDVICVTANLGDSGGGFKALQTQLQTTPDIQHLIQAHFRPEPSPQQGSWLAAHPEVHAMMDISDGLDCDLKRLLKKSHQGAEIDLNQIPLSASLKKVSANEGWDAMQLALTGGEDYCLLLTVAAESFDNLQQTFRDAFNTPLFPVGRITGDSNELLYLKNKQKIPINYPNYNHFLEDTK